MIDRTKKIPLYKQLEMIIQDRIMQGDLGKGEHLPTEVELCELYGISRITVRGALRELENYGLIERVPGRGTIVINRSVQAATSRIIGFTSMVKAQGYESKRKILSMNLKVGNQELDTLFNYSGKKGDHPYWHIKTLRYIDDEPAVLMNHYVSKEIGDQMVKHDLSRVSFYDLYETLSGMRVIQKNSIMSAFQASPDIAKILEVKIGEPLMWYRGISILEDGTPIEVGYYVYVGKKFVFEASNLLPVEANALISRSIVNELSF